MLTAVLKKITQTVCLYFLLISTGSSAVPTFAHFALDEASAQWQGVPGEVIDELGNANSAFAIGTSQGVGSLPGLTCNSVNIPLNQSVGAQYGIDTGIDVDQDIGNVGSISFWYQANTNWINSRNRTLFDASPDNLGFPASKFFLMILTGDGRLSFAVEDDADDDFVVQSPAQNFVSGEWVHIAASWNYSGSLKIFINGSLVASDQFATSGQIGDITTLYFGDNRSSYNGGEGTATSANGFIDEVRIHNQELTEIEINELITSDENSTRQCPTPNLEIKPYAYFTLDEVNFDWNGTPGEVIDEMGNALDAFMLGTAAGTDSVPAKVCNGVNVLPNSSISPGYGIDTNFDFNQLIGSRGSIDFWYKSNTDWIGGGDRVLMEASNENVPSPKYYYFLLLDNGRLHLGLEDSNDLDLRFESAPQNFAAGEWVHIALSWDMSRERKIFVNGIEVASDNRATTGTLGDLRSMYIGDNRGTYLSRITKRSANGILDEVRIYRSALTTEQIIADMQATHDCPVLPLDHIRLEATSNQALTCLPADITIKACANADCTELFTAGTVTVDLSPQGWLGNDPLSFDNGQITAQLQHTTAEAVTLDAIATSHAVQNPVRCFFGSNIETSCDITFEDAGFVIDFNEEPATSCKPGTATIRAIKKNDETQSCEAAFSGTRTVQFWNDYLIPDTGTINFNLEGNLIATSNPGTPISLTFDQNASSSFSYNYNDAGEIRLNAFYQDADGLTLSGDSSLVSLPAGIAIYSDDFPFGDSVCSDADAATASCAVYKKAGEPFNLKIKAACWSVDDASDLDISNNPATPNFEFNNILINHSLIAPSGGVNGNISQSNSNLTPTDDGVKTINQTISEVGVFKFSLTPITYLSNPVPTQNSANIGRFIPDKFNVNNLQNGAFSTECPGYSYIGELNSTGDGAISYLTQPQFDITPVNTEDETTQNYQGEYEIITKDIFDAGLTDQIEVKLDPAEDATQTGSDGSTKMAINSSITTNDIKADYTNNNGVLTYRFNSVDHFSYTRDNNSEIPQFTSDVELTIATVKDSDGVQASASLPLMLTPTGVELRFGRVNMDNVGGSELDDLTMPMYTEYLSNSVGNYSVNMDDNCSIINNVNLKIDPTPAGYAISNVNIDNPISNAGIFNITLLSPGAGNNIKVEITPNLGNTTLDGIPGANLPWLQYKWINGLNFTDNPNAEATFGIFGGNQVNIYRNQVFQ